MNDHDDRGGALTGPIVVVARGNRSGGHAMIWAFALLTMMLGSWGAWSWSLIPLDVHGRVGKIEYQSDSGYRWRILELDDGRSFVIDRRITDQLGDWQDLGGQRVDTDSGSATLRVGRHTAHLGPSVEFWKILFTFATLALAAAVTRRRPPFRRGGALK